MKSQPNRPNVLKLEKNSRLCTFCTNDMGWLERHRQKLIYPHLSRSLFSNDTGLRVTFFILALRSE